MPIPRRIISIWLSHDPVLPELVARCVASQKALGYEFLEINLENCYKGSKYVNDCIAVKKWAKASDWLRMFYLNELGGIYLDTDCEMEPGKTLDDLLNNKMFVGREKNNFIANGIIGAEAGHPILKDYMDTVERNFIGSGELVFAPGMYLWNEKLQYKPIGEVTIYPPAFFLPFDWQSGIMEKTEDTRMVHWFNKSWL